MDYNNSETNLFGIDGEADNVMSDDANCNETDNMNYDETVNLMLDDAAINYEETEAALSSIRSKLNKSDIFTKHESQSSMTTIVDLVKKAKHSIMTESQCIDLDIVNDEKSESSFSDNLGMIGLMLSDQEFESDNTHKITLKHSDSSNTSLSSTNSENDGPRMFWNQKDLEYDEEMNVLQRLMLNPNEVLENVRSPQSDYYEKKIKKYSLSDWDDKKPEKHKKRKIKSSKTVKKNKKSKKKKKSDKSEKNHINK